MVLMFILWLIVVSSVFFSPNARWLFVVILLRNACSDTLPIFKSDICFLMIELFDFRIDFACKPILGVQQAAVPTPIPSKDIACLRHLLYCAGVSL